MSGLQVQGKVQTYNAMYPISIIGVLTAFKMVRTNIGIHKRLALWLFPYFLNKLAAAALTARLSFKSKLQHYCVKMEY